MRVQHIKAQVDKSRLNYRLISHTKKGFAFKRVLYGFPLNRILILFLKCFERLNFNSTHIPEF